MSEVANACPECKSFNTHGEVDAQNNEVTTCSSCGHTWTVRVIGSEEGPWRTGRKVGRTVYFNDQIVGLMDTPELAGMVTASANVATATLNDERLKALRHAAKAAERMKVASALKHIINADSTIEVADVLAVTAFVLTHLEAIEKVIGKEEP